MKILFILGILSGLGGVVGNALAQNGIAAFWALVATVWASAAYILSLIIEKEILK